MKVCLVGEREWLGNWNGGEGGREKGEGGWSEQIAPWEGNGGKSNLGLRKIIVKEKSKYRSSIAREREKSIK